MADPEGEVPIVTSRLGGFLGSPDPTSGVAWGVNGLAFRSERVLVLTRLADLSTPIGRDFDGDGLVDIWESTQSQRYGGCGGGSRPGRHEHIR